MSSKRLSDQEPLAYRIRDAARILSLSEQTFWQLVKDGKLHSRKVGRAVLISRSAIEMLLSGGSEGGEQ